MTDTPTTFRDPSDLESLDSFLATEPLRDDILDLSRQNNLHPLSPWLSAQFDSLIEDQEIIDLERVGVLREDIVSYLRAYREQAGVSNMVLGMSGGVDSALTAALFKEAGWTVTGFMLPIEQNPDETARGLEACIALDINHHTIDLTRAYQDMVTQLGYTDTKLDDEDRPAAVRRGNVRARLRMITLYNMASSLGGIVGSTDNLSELQAGFWTLHGDVGDVSPIQSCTKSWEVPALARMVGVPESTWRATPTDGLGISAGDEHQLGCTYLEWDIMAEMLARAVYAFSDEWVDGDRVSFSDLLTWLPGTLSDDDQRIAAAVYTRMKASWFKRANPVNTPHSFFDVFGNLARMDRCFGQPPIVANP